MRPYFIVLAGCLLVGYAHAQELPYTVCENCWDPDSLGNHRAVITVPAPGKVATARIEWRRRDGNPEDKMILVSDAKGNLIRNVIRGKVNREFGEISFEPAAGVGEYFVYYLKYFTKGRSNYPTVVYPEFEETASRDWETVARSNKGVPARVKELQSIDALNSFYPMEVIATASETEAMRAKGSGQPFMVFPEDRMNPVILREDLPQRWILRGPSDTFNGTAEKGENYAFQIGIWAHEASLKNLTVRFSELSGAAGKFDGLSCLNTEGKGWDGKALRKEVDVERGVIQPLWCLVPVPANVSPGEYTGTATIQAEDAEPRNISINLTVTDKTAVNGGVDEPWKQTRLAWLNSSLAANDNVIAPYTPIEVKGYFMNILGRKLEIGENGLPKQITTYFSPLMTKFDNVGKPLLTSPFNFQVLRPNNTEYKWVTTTKAEIKKEGDGAARWRSVSSTANGLTMVVTGRLEFDGFITYSIKLTSDRNIQVGNTRMRMPIRRPFARYMMGLGQRGGIRPSRFSWTWDVADKNQDGAWIGGVNGGIQFSLRAENYVRPLNTNFYLQKPLNLPPSWGNGGKGGISLGEDAMTATFTAYSGARNLKAGDTLHYNFTLLLTPFHTLDTDFQWRTRFYHKYSPVDTILKRGATVVNIHHANAINPYINYPFIRTKEMKDYIDEAHRKGLKVKIYNTVRELSNHAYETQVMRSLGTEIYSPGPAGGFSWLQEHLGDDYIAAWFVPELKDAAIINSGMSRWHNYYVEGMNWLVKNVGIDGIYLDDVAFDRTTMKRIRRVLKSDRGPGIIDLHSANQYNKRDGFNNSANLYLEHFPYLNRLWFGEYFDYDSKPDFWMTEVSGIPFGLMGEMLEKGGNPWRGMIYGMTNRMPWTENSDPSHLWKVWDDFGMKGSEMIGYWVEKNPVKTDNPEVLATIYKRSDRVMIAVASWAPKDVLVKLAIDWKSLGLKPTSTAVAPAIKDFQDPQTVNFTEGFVIPEGKGLLLIVK